MEINIEKILKEFAEKNTKVEAICFGNMQNSEDEEIKCCVIITEPPYRRNFCDAITELDLDIYEKLKRNINLIYLPLGKNHIKYFDKVIYKKPI